MSQEDRERDFGEILAEFESGGGPAGRERDPEPGERVRGEVLSVGAEAVFVDVGGKSDAMVARTELTDEEGELTVGVGDEVEGLITGRDEGSGCLVLRVRAGRSGLGPGDEELAVEEIRQAQALGMPVEGTVAETVKGGVEVKLSGLRAFCPISQLDDSYVEDAASWVGRRLSFKVSRFEPSGRGGRPNVVLSRRELLEDERRRAREETLARLEPESVVRGTVTSVTGYGAFVDLGGVEGLLHVSEISHQRVEDPAEIFQPGDVVEVQVLSLEEREGKDPRISLSRRALEKDPWEGVAARFPVGSRVEGRVVRLEPYGAFVRVAPGLDGLVHVSELASDRRVDHPRDVVELGDEVEVEVLDVDAVKRRIALARVEGRGPAGGDEGAAERPAAPGFGAMAAAFEELDEEDG